MDQELFNFGAISGHQGLLKATDPDWNGSNTIFLKALYGLKSSGKRLTEVIHSILKDMKFTLPRLIHAFASEKNTD